MQPTGILIVTHNSAAHIGACLDAVARMRGTLVMKNGRVVGSGPVTAMTKDEVLGMIILGKCPPGAAPGPGAMAA